MILSFMGGMANLGALFFALAIFFIAISWSNFVDAQIPFNENFNIICGSENINMSGYDLELELTNSTGSAVQSTEAFFYGSIEMLLKTKPGQSAGTATTFYLSSSGSYHDEVDFELLGNVSGQPYTIHTNIYTQGNGSREQQFRPWFDPTADYHNYTIHWNPSEIVWFVDGTPIRVFRNYEDQGVGYPNDQGMSAYASSWDADTWATENGGIKINWTYAPFYGNYRNFNPRACRWNGSASIAACSAPIAQNWWTSSNYSQLNSTQLDEMNAFRNSSMVYNYCTDYTRYPDGDLPRECSLPQY